LIVFFIIYIYDARSNKYQTIMKLCVLQRNFLQGKNNSSSVPSEAGYAVLHNCVLLTYSYGCPLGRLGRRPAFMNTAKG